MGGALWAAETTVGRIEFERQPFCEADRGLLLMTEKMAASPPTEIANARRNNGRISREPTPQVAPRHADIFHSSLKGNARD